MPTAPEAPPNVDDPPTEPEPEPGAGTETPAPPNVDDPPTEQEPPPSAGCRGVPDDLQAAGDATLRAAIDRIDPTGEDGVYILRFRSRSARAGCGFENHAFNDVYWSRDEDNQPCTWSRLRTAGHGGSELQHLSFRVPQAGSFWLAGRTNLGSGEDRLRSGWAVAREVVAVVTNGQGAGEKTYSIGGRTVTVVEESGVPEGIEVDLADLAPSEEPLENLAPSEEPLELTFAPVAEPAASDMYNFGSAGARTVVDVRVTEGSVPAPGLRLCLPVVDAVRDAARGRPLLLLHYNEDRMAWEAIGSEESGDGSMVCASGVTGFSPFAVGYEDTAPGFPDDFTLTGLVFTVDEAIEPVTLPEATGGDGTEHELGPLPLVLAPGITFNRETYTLSGTPEEEFEEKGYTWTARDIDGEEDSLEFTLEIKAAVGPARARLKAINESILPELSRASWGSAMGALSRRLGSEAVGGGGSGVSAERLSAAMAGFMQSNEQALEEGGVSWKELWSGQSFAVTLGGGGEGAGPGGGGRPVTVWGSGERRDLSRDVPSLKWLGELFAAHVGADVGLGSGVTGGAGVSWYESETDYTDRSGEDGPIEGVHRSWLASVQPYLGWSLEGGSRLWGALGYGAGEVELVDEALMERFGRQKSGSELLAVAAGGAVRLVSGGGAWLDLKGEGQATRYEVDENGDLIEGLSVKTQRLRLSAEGTREYALSGGARLSPSGEVGVRWDGGDGATGAGVEVGGGLSWTGPGRGLVMEARGRALLAHRGDLEEWGLSGGLRLEPRGDGRGLSLRVEPVWGAAGSGVSRLWEEGVAGGRSPGGGPGVERAGGGVEAELGYGCSAFGGFGVATPYTRIGVGQQERRYGVGWRLHRAGEAFEMDVEGWRREPAIQRPEHGLRIETRLLW